MKPVTFRFTMNANEKLILETERETTLWEANKLWEARKQMKTASVRDRVAAAVIRAEAKIKKADRAFDYHTAMDLISDAQEALRTF